MAETMSDEAAEIVREMARMRYELHDDVESVVDTARAMTDWRWYVKNYPWYCLGAAAAIGYLAVPRRLEVMRPDAATLTQLARDDKLVVKQQSQTEPRQGLAGSVLSFASSLLLRAGLQYAGQKFGEIMKPNDSGGIGR